MKSEEFKLHFIAKRRLSTLNCNTNLNSSLFTFHSSLKLLLDRKLVAECEQEYVVCGTLCIECESFCETYVISKVEDAVVFLV